MKVRTICLCLLLSMTLVGAGCAGRRERSGASSGFTDGVFTPTEADAQARLKEMVRELIASEKHYTDARSVPVVRRRPYYFREYSVYPDGADGFEVDFRQVDSRIRPLVAEVRMKKVRYSTQMHRKQDSAMQDMSFLRDVGMETLVYEWHNGRWTRTGAIFNAHTTEEQVNGQWVPRREETVRVNPAEERPGWFGRMWERIRGGE